MTAPRPRLSRGGGIRRTAPKAGTPVRQMERMGGKRWGSTVRPSRSGEGRRSQRIGTGASARGCAAAGLGRATAVHPTAEVAQAGWPFPGMARSQGAALTAVWSIKVPQADIPAGANRPVIGGAAPRSARTASMIVTRLRTAAHMLRDWPGAVRVSTRPCRAASGLPTKSREQPARDAVQRRPGTLSAWLNTQQRPLAASMSA